MKLPDCWRGTHADWTAIGNSGHALNPGCDRSKRSLERQFRREVHRGAVPPRFRNRCPDAHRGPRFSNLPVPMRFNCTAYGFLDDSLKEDCATITISLERRDPKKGVEISVARSGCPLENGYAERRIRTLKAEEVPLNAYQDTHEARAHIGTCSHAGVQSETPAFGVRVSDTSGISTTNLLLTLRNCGLHKRMHYTTLHEEYIK